MSMRVNALPRLGIWFWVFELINLHLNGLLATQSGEVRIGDTPVVESNLVEIRRRVGAVFQDADDQLFMSSVREDVAFGPANLGVSGAELDELVERTLERVGATGYADRNPHHLSGGEKRRVAIATVLSMDPDVLILDEPTSGLDPAGRRELIDLLSSLTQTQLIVTHDLPLALHPARGSLTPPRWAAAIISAKALAGRALDT